MAFHQIVPSPSTALNSTYKIPNYTIAQLPATLMHKRCSSCKAHDDMMYTMLLSLTYVVNYFLNSHVYFYVLSTISYIMDIFTKPLCYDNLRSQIEGYTNFLFFLKFSILPLLFELNRLLIFKKISSLPAFLGFHLKLFPSSPLLLEPTNLLDLKKNSCPSFPLY